MLNHIAALSQMLFIYIVLGLAFYGWGKIVIGMLPIPKPLPGARILSIWIGWAMMVLLLQILHLFLPLTAYTVIPLFMLGVFAAFKSGIGISSIVKKWQTRKLHFSLGLMGTLLIIIWIASRAMLSPTLYDAGLYYFNTIRWINSFPIVPGLGNLHGRLAFNQSLFVYTAALNFYPFYNHGHSITISFLFLLTAATLVNDIRPVFNNPSLLAKSSPFKLLPALFCLPMLTYLGISSLDLSSASPDFASKLLELILFVIFARSLIEWRETGSISKLDFLTLSMLAATAITVKLSNLVFAAAIWGIIFLFTWFSADKNFKQILLFLALPGMTVAVWMMRGYILSGAPLYPSTLGYLGLPWAVPQAQVTAEANWVYSWARKPHTHWSVVLGNTNWFQPWLLKVSNDFLRIVYPVSLSILSLLAIAVISITKKLKNLFIFEWIILLPPLFSLVYWFFTAPEPRFANLLFFLFDTAAIILFFVAIQPLLSPRKFFFALVAVLLLTNYPYLRISIGLPDLFRTVSTQGYEAVQQAALTTYQTTSNLTIYTPESGDQCWDSPLPCTPHFKKTLTLRESDRLASGFSQSPRPLKFLTKMNRQ